MNQELQTENAKLISILLVDDEPRILRSLKAALKRKFRVYIANGGQEAIQLLNSKKISVIISDEKMPIMMGHELLLWSKVNFPHIGRILMSGFSGLDKLCNSIKNAQIHHHITKPWNINEITQLIGNIALQHNISKTTSQPEELSLNDSQLAILNTIDENNNLYKKASKAISKKHHILNNIESVDKLLEQNSHIGVLFIDDNQADQQTVNLVLTLHVKYPQVIIIIATAAADGTNAIKLLSEGNIFRYLVKPLTITKLIPMLNAAFNQHDENPNMINSDISNHENESSVSKYWDKFSSLWH